MFAGAVRETVFSRKEVIDRVNKEFVPVATRAAAVHRGGRAAEERLLAEIGRSKPAGQGLCVLNSDGQVLDWVLMFDDDDAVLKFLDDALERYRTHPDGTKTVQTRRFIRYPGTRRPDMSTAARSAPVAHRHLNSERCPGSLERPPGTRLVRVYGRVLDAAGRPLADTLNQHHYAQDEFVLTDGLESQLVAALQDAGDKPVLLPRALARICAKHAALGHLDVQPVDNPSGGTTDLKTCELRAVQEKPGLFRLEGSTDVTSRLGRASPRNRGSDGRHYEHDVRLAWTGYLRVESGKVTGLLLEGHGRERLVWGSGAAGARRTDAAVASLPSGRPLYLDRKVRYGLIFE